MATGTGEFDIDLLQGGDQVPAPIGIVPSAGAFGFGPLPEGSVQGSRYTGFFTGPNFPLGDSSFGSGSLDVPTTSSGDVAGFDYGIDSVLVPTDYTAGSSLSSTMFFSGATFASLGLTPGSYTYTYGQDFEVELAFRKDFGPNCNPFLGPDFIRVNIGTVPLPASAPLFGAALVALGMVGYRMTRNGTAAA